MSFIATIAGTSYTLPTEGDTGWGSETSDWMAAVSTELLQRSGGAFAITADVNFGANFGLVSVYFKSRTSNISTAGIVRLANADSIGWRNAANSANLLLAVDSSNNLTWNGNIIIPSTGVIQPAQGGTGISSYTAGDILYATAGTTLAKLAIGTANYVLTSNGTAPAYSLIVNANIDNAAAIARTKLASGSANHVLINDGSGVMSSEASLDETRGGTAQTTYTTGDILYASASNTLSKLALGTSGYYLQSNGTNVVYGPIVTGIEGPSATAITLTADSFSDVYISSPASAINQDLPTTNVQEGKIFRIVVTGATTTNTVTIRSSNADTIDLIAGSGYVLVQALQASPTTSAHWRVLEYQETMSYSVTWESAASSSDNTSTTVTLSRWTGGHIQYNQPPLLITLSAGPSSFIMAAGSAFPARFRPATRRDMCVPCFNNGAAIDSPGRISINTNGINTLVRGNLTSDFTNGASGGMQIGNVFTYSST